MSHANISVFVPHLGCPHRCSFCDQNSITGTSLLPGEREIDNAVAAAVGSKGYSKTDTELAFFGGSFTAIDRVYMTELLKAAGKYVKNGTIKGIRISTRPDYIDSEVLGILKEYGVTSIELGAQSMCDDVLKANLRGHTAADVVQASGLIKENGFELGLQMMTGLYKSSEEKDRYTARRIIELKPETVRIYPAVTLENTVLAVYYSRGEYFPPSLEDTVALCADLICEFNSAGIRVIRVGLHSIDNGAYVAGPWHPSFRELCDSRIYFKKITGLIKTAGKYNLRVSPGEVSKVTGHKKSNLNALKKMGYICRVVPDGSIEPFCVVPERMKDSCI